MLTPPIRQKLSSITQETVYPSKHGVSLAAWDSKRAPNFSSCQPCAAVVSNTLKSSSRTLSAQIEHTYLKFSSSLTKNLNLAPKNSQSQLLTPKSRSHKCSTKDECQNTTNQKNPSFFLRTTAKTKYLTPQTEKLKIRTAPMIFKSTIGTSFNIIAYIPKRSHLRQYRLHFSKKENTKRRRRKKAGWEAEKQQR